MRRSAPQRLEVVSGIHPAAVRSLSAPPVTWPEGRPFRTEASPIALQSSPARCQNVSFKLREPAMDLPCPFCGREPRTLRCGSWNPAAARTYRLGAQHGNHIPGRLTRNRKSEARSLGRGGVRVDRRRSSLAHQVLADHDLLDLHCALGASPSV